MTFEIANFQQMILREISDKNMHQKDIAQTYALGILQHQKGRTVAWDKINKAIINRWSHSGLERIKQMAWSGSCYEE